MLTVKFHLTNCILNDYYIVSRPNKRKYDLNRYH